MSVSRAAVAQGGANTLETLAQTVTVDPNTKIAKVKFTSHAHDSVTVQLSAQYTSPDSAGDNSAKDDSLANIWSLVPWIKDLPKRAAIAPHETITLTLHLAVPAKLAHGDYSAYVIATQVEHAAANTGMTGTGITSTAGATGQVLTMSNMTMGAGGATPAVKGKDGNTAPRAITKVVYHVN